MPSEPRWLTPETAINFNRALVAETNETHFLRDEGLLESACARPQNIWAYEGEEDVVVLASALGVGISRNHAFEEGNKRTGLACAIDFLETNGIGIPGENDEALGRTLDAVVARTLPPEAFTNHLRDLAEYDPPHEEE